MILCLIDSYYEALLQIKELANQIIFKHTSPTSLNFKMFSFSLSIVNMTKDESLYNEGMKPLLYSTKDAQLHNIGWRRCGDNITYFCNDNG